MPSNVGGVAAGDERNALELRALRAARHERRFLRREADELRLDLLIGAARNLRVARLHFDRVRARLPRRCA